MTIKAAELIIVRNEFYARSYKQIKTVIALLLIILIVLICFVVYQSRSIVLAPRYVPTTPDGRLIISPDTSIDHLILSKQQVLPSGVISGMPAPTKTYDELAPNGEDALVLYWAQMAVADMFDYDYIHYRRVIEGARKYFTPEGHGNFIQALIDSKNLQTVKARSAVVIPTIDSVKILSTSMYSGRYSWDIQVLIKLTYESATADDPIVQNLIAKLSVVRVTTLKSPFYGLAIYQLNFEQNFGVGDT